MAAIAVVVGLVVTVATSTPAAAIEGGEVVPAAETPDWVVFVRSDRPNGSTGACSGSLIAADAVLTAAHCLFDEHGRRTPDAAITAVIGRPDLDDESRGVSRTVKHAVMHPDYRWSPSLALHDLAVLHIDPVPAGFQLVPLAAEAPPVLVDPVLLGYGATEPDGPHARQLRRTPIGAYTGNACLDHWAGGRVVTCLHPHDDHVDLRPGDSGAPVVIRHRGAWVQHLVLNSITDAERVGLAATTGGATTTVDHRRWIVETADLLDPEPGSVLVDLADESGGGWLVTPEGHRRRVPDNAMVACLVATGAARVEATGQQIHQVAEEVGLHAHCDPPTPEPEPEIDSGPGEPSDRYLLLVERGAGPEELFEALAFLLRELMTHYGPPVAEAEVQAEVQAETVPATPTMTNAIPTT